MPESVLPTEEELQERQRQVVEILSRDGKPVDDKDIRMVVDRYAWYRRIPNSQEWRAKLEKVSAYAAKLQEVLSSAEFEGHLLFPFLNAILGSALFTDEEKERYMWEKPQSVAVSKEELLWKEALFRMDQMLNGLQLSSEYALRTEPSSGGGLKAFMGVSAQYELAGCCMEIWTKYRSDVASSAEDGDFFSLVEGVFELATTRYHFENTRQDGITTAVKAACKGYKDFCKQLDTDYPNGVPNNLIRVRVGCHWSVVEWIE